MTIIELYDRISDWLDSRRRHKAEATDSYLGIIEQACEQLVNLSPDITDGSRLLQERVRALYADAGMVLGARLESSDLALVMRALASARIFYWIRVLSVNYTDEFGSVAELENLIARRGGPKGRGFESFDIVQRALLAMCPDSAEDVMAAYNRPELALENLRSACLKDFGELKALRARLQAR